eukprot:scaffold640_cov166-Amphora_coffeaeformis.AAC.8
MGEMTEPAVPKQTQHPIDIALWLAHLLGLVADSLTSHVSPPESLFVFRLLISPSWKDSAVNGGRSPLGA